MKKKIMILLLLLITIGMVGCQNKEEVIEETEQVDIIEYRKKGDRLVDDITGEKNEKEKRLLKQYDLIDRPIIVNSIREIEKFVKEKEGYMKGVYIGVGAAIDGEREQELIDEGLKKLGGNLEGNVDSLRDIEDPYPYLENKMVNYGKLVVGQLLDYVKVIKGEYESIVSLYNNRPQTKKIIDTRNLSGLNEKFKLKDTIVKSSVLYVEEMDKEANKIREMLGEAPIEYGKVLVEDDTYEEVSEFIVPEDKYRIEIKEDTFEEGTTTIENNN